MPILGTETLPAVELTKRDYEDNPSPDTNPFLISRMLLSRELVMLVTICIAQALVQACLAQGMLPDAVIGQSLGVGTTQSTWGPAAYSLTSGAFMLPAGQIGDMYGHRHCFVGALVWFAISSLMTGGMACAMLVPCAIAILGSIYKKGPRKNLVFSLYAAGSPVGFTLGAVFSALLTQLAWWPWMFYSTALVCLGLGAISFVAIPKLPGEHYRNNDQDGSAGKTWRKDFDWIGGLTGLTGMVLFNIAWNRAPAVGWDAPDVIVTCVTGLVSFVAFLFVERRVKQPLIPVDKLSGRAILVLVTTGLGWASFGVLIYYLIQFTLIFRGHSLLGTAAQISPVPFAGLAASYMNTFLLGKGVLATDILAFSLLWFTVGNILLATMPIHQIYWKQAFWIYVLAPFGMDLNFPSATLVVSQLVPPERQGIAASLVATVVYYSQSVGLGMAGTVQAYVSEPDALKGYRGAMYTGIGLSGLGLLTALWPVVTHRLQKRE